MFSFVILNSGGAKNNMHRLQEKWEMRISTTQYGRSVEITKYSKSELILKATQPTITKLLVN